MADKKSNDSVNEPVAPVRVSSEPMPARAETKRDERDDRDTEAVADVQHGGYTPTDEDYERARTEGAGREPELPAGVVKGRGRDKN